MRAVISTLVLALGALSLFGCAHPSAYTVTPVSFEAIDGKVDGQWFAREVTDKDSHLSVIELVYCPTLPNVTTVCRTSVVWQDGTSALYDTFAHGVPAAPAAPAEAPPAVPPTPGPEAAPPAPGH